MKRTSTVQAASLPAPRTTTSRRGSRLASAVRVLADVLERQASRGGRPRNAELRPGALRAARLAAGMSRAGLAAELAARGCAVTPKSIYLWECAKTAPSPARLGALAVVLGLERGELLAAG